MSQTKFGWFQSLEPTAQEYYGNGIRAAGAAKFIIRLRKTKKEDVMNQEEFDKLGDEDSQTQHEWCIARDKQLQELWKCSCGKKLLTKGYIWFRRWNNFKTDHRLGDDPKGSGYYCDTCADEREAGGY